MSQPAARVGDITVCVGSPNTIVKGSPVVLINVKPDAARMGVIVVGASS